MFDAFLGLCGMIEVVGGHRPEGVPGRARFATPIDIVGAWRAEAFGEPVVIGGHLVQPDDMVLADRDGVILLESSAAKDVIAAAEAKMATEGEMVRAIRAGVDPQEAYMKYRVF